MQDYSLSGSQNGTMTSNDLEITASVCTATILHIPISPEPMKSIQIDSKIIRTNKEMLKLYKNVNCHGKLNFEKHGCQTLVAIKPSSHVNNEMPSKLLHINCKKSHSLEVFALILKSYEC